MILIEIGMSQFYILSLILHSRGFCIMMYKGLNCEVLDSRSDQEGHILMIKIKLQDDIYNIINIYAPTNISEWNVF